MAALQLHITLNDIEPPIWRRLWEVLQIAMGWQNQHLHQFIRGERGADQLVYAPPSDDGFEDLEFTTLQRDETRVRARTIRPLVGDAVIYECDLGDSWQHTLLLEWVLLVDPLEQWLPLCLDGRRSAAPEDVGGTGGYEEFLEVLANLKEATSLYLEEFPTGMSGRR